MRLVLEIQRRPPGLGEGQARAVFEARGGTIGRTANNDLTLPAAGVSRHHASVHWHNGAFLIEDCSANGMSLNGQPLPHHQPQPLQNGDRLGIDEFEIVASVVAEAPALGADPYAGGALGETPLADGLLASDAAAPSLLAEPIAESAPQAPAWNHTPGLADHYAPPPSAATSASGTVLPENWDLSVLRPLQPSPAVAPIAAAIPPAIPADEPRTAERSELLK
ncbi:MAG: FHA domain-containing protein, partial [Solimonas sp.]